MSLEIILAQIAFSKALLQRDLFVRGFYCHLFEAHPEIRPLFPTDMSGQQGKMVDTLTLLTLHLQDREHLVSGLRELGGRHRGYGTVGAHYPAVEEAMLASLRAVLGDEWTPEMAESCARVLKWVSEVMMSGSESPIPAM